MLALLITSFNAFGQRPEEVVSAAQTPDVASSSRATGDTSRQRSTVGLPLFANGGVTTTRLKLYGWETEQRLGGVLRPKQLDVKNGRPLQDWEIATENLASGRPLLPALPGLTPQKLKISRHALIATYTFK
jgi:hypothetical protein